MLRNYLTVTIRNLSRHRLYTLINVFSLTIGMMACVIALLFVGRELSYDSHHALSDRIHRVVLNFGNGNHSASTSGALAAVAEKSIPEIDMATRLFGDNVRVVTDTGFSRVEWVTLVDDRFFDVFSLTFVHGDPETALKLPNQLVVSESFADRFFGDENPIGKIVTFDRRSWQGSYVISGVVLDDSKSSIFRVNAFHTTPPADPFPKSHWEGWIQNLGPRHSLATYVIPSAGANLENLEQKLTGLLTPHLLERDQGKFSYHLQPLRRVRLFSQTDYGIGSGGHIVILYLYSGVAALVLLIACVNFVNLSTAMSTLRAREVGLRKVSGARRAQLVRQFLGESALLAFIAVLFAVGLLELVLPSVNSLLRTDLGLTDLGMPALLGGLLVVAVTTALLAGAYPAFYLSRFEPSQVLRSSFAAGLGGTRLRQSLVVLQFSLSILLGIATVGIHRQISYANDMDLGFDRDVLILPIFSGDTLSQTKEPWLSSRYESVKNRFEAISGVAVTAGIRFLPGWSGGFVRDLRPEGYGDEVWRIRVQETDDGYLQTFGLQLVAGRNFRKEDGLAGYILNEAAVRELGWHDQGTGYEGAIGRVVNTRARGHITEGVVIGVVKDFHHSSIRKRIGPAAIKHFPKFYFHLAIKLHQDASPDLLEDLKAAWGEFRPERPFEYEYLDDYLERGYQAESHMRRMCSWFAAIALGLACLGLFGLASHTTVRRTKEIGIRKSLGATASSVIILLSGEFTKLVLLSNIFAWPLAYLFLSAWLESFAYRRELDLLPFLLTGAVALIITLLTVSYQSMKAARTDPVTALRYD